MGPPEHPFYADAIEQSTQNQRRWHPRLCLAPRAWRIAVCADQLRAGQARATIAHEGSALKGKNVIEPSHREASTVAAGMLGEVSATLAELVCVMSVRLGCELPQVIVQVHLQELAPLPCRHPPE